MNSGAYKALEDAGHVTEKPPSDVNEVDVHIIRCSGVKPRRQGMSGVPRVRTGSRGSGPGQECQSPLTYFEYLVSLTKNSFIIWLFYRNTAESIRGVPFL